MYKFYILLFWLSYSYCQNDVLVEIKLRKNNVTEYYCLTNSSRAITWISEDPTTVRQSSIFIPNKLIENIPLMRSNEIFPNSEQYDISEAILDKRWEDLELYTTTFRRKENESLLHFVPVLNNLKPNFKVALSIRAKEGHIFLCDGENISVSNCYWILLQAFVEKYTVIRKCKNGEIPLENMIRIKHSCAKRLKQIKHDSTNGDYLTNDSWSHFKLQKQGNNLTLFKLINKDLDDIIIDFYDNNSVINVTHMIVHSKRGPGFWKIHQRNYIYVHHDIPSSNPILLTKLNVVDNSTCISMYVSMCTSCNITLKLTGSTNAPYTKEETFQNQNERWTEIRFFVNGVPSKSVKLTLFTGSYNDNNSKNFWAFDTNFTTCNGKEFRVLQAKTPLRCQLMSGNRNLISFDEETNFDDKNCFNNSEKRFCVPSQWFPKNCTTEICSKLRSGAICPTFIEQLSQKQCKSVNSFDDPSTIPTTVVYVCVVFILLIIILTIIIVVLVKRCKSISKYESTNEIETGTAIMPDIESDHRKIDSGPVKVTKLEQYVKDGLENQKFERQYELLPQSPTKPRVCGASKPNISKNRYANLIAYDHSRVVLEKIDGNNYSDYINANYIDGYKIRKAYIATQGPKKTTLHDFWRMIWQENVRNIVMMANLYEDGEEKVCKYWPEINQCCAFGDITVQHVFTKVYATYEHRVFNLNRRKQARKVEQYHFKSWPDHGVPLYPQSLVPFLEKLLQIPLNSKSPIVIHCSAGVGRTGTIILCDICLRMAAQESAIDFFGNIKKLREQRSNMVNSILQYKLVHLVILECLVGLKTSIPCNQIENTVQHLLENGKVAAQIKYLDDTAWQDQAMKEMMSEQDTLKVVKEKNRFSTIIPDIQGRVSLSPYPREDLDSIYINAVKVDDFQSPGRFIVTQQPMPNTLGDFWRLIVEYGISVVISLNEICLKNKNSCHFYPSKTNSNLNPVDYITLKHASTLCLNCYDLITIHLYIRENEDYRIVEILCFKNWAPQRNCPGKIEDFLTFWEDSHAKSRNSEPVIITCFDGVRASGLYTALSFIIEKMKLEQLCDVCQAVRTVRHNRMQFVQEEEQFVFLYEAAVKYIKGFQSYSNFT